MSEHVFDLGDAGPLDDDSATARAINLAERLLDEVARPQHSWHAIERMASALARLAALMMGPTAAPPGPLSPSPQGASGSAPSTAWPEAASTDQPCTAPASPGR